MQKSPQQIQKKKAKVSYHEKPSPSFFFCKKRKQCPYKPSSVCILPEVRTESAIYLALKSPLGSSTLPSTVARRLRTSRPQTAVYMSLQLPDGTA